MKLLQNKMWWTGVLVMSAGSWLGWQKYETQQMETDRDKAIAMSEKMFKPEKAQAVCFGRMVFEPPKGAHVQGSIFQYPGAQNIEETLNVTQAQYNKTVEDFEQHLRETKHEKDPSLLKSIRIVPGDQSAKVYDHWAHELDTTGTNLTAFALHRDTQYRFASEVSSIYTKWATDAIIAALAHLRPLATDEVPTEHGFCLNTAFIPDTLKGEWHERAEMSFKVSPWQDVWISIETETRHAPDETLIERIKTAPQRVPGSTRGMTTIRSGERTVNGRKGQEVLAQFKGEGKSFYLFFWEIAGELNSHDPPIINLDLKIGQQTGHSELTQDQALALWEYLLVHLRLRPTTAATKTSDATPPEMALGELAATGRTCPHTGWWDCAETSAQVRGGRRQFFHAGEPMPDAVLLGKPGLLQRIKGDAPTYRTATVWNSSATKRRRRLPILLRFPRRLLRKAPPARRLLLAPETTRRPRPSQAARRRPSTRVEPCPASFASATRPTTVAR